MEPQAQQPTARIEDALWPPPAGFLTESTVHLADYLVVPNGERPRFFLPADREAAVAVLRHFRSDGTRGARLRMAALRLVIRLSGGWPLARRIRVSGPSSAVDTIESYLETLLGPDLRLGIHLGPARANRKPILQVLGPDNEPLAFGKLGVTPLTRRLVGTEGEALGVLGGLEMPGIRLPRVLHTGEWGAAKVLLTTPLPLARATRNVARAQRTRAMVTVARAGGTYYAPPGASSWLADRRKQVTALPHAEIREDLLRALDRISEIQASWEFGSWHGDWTVWNTASLQGDVLIWDWERFDTDVPVGWDALHDALREAFVTSSPTPSVAQDLLDRAPALLADFGVSPEAAPGVTHAYLVELALRYTADGQREAGGRTARVEEWLIPLLPGD